MDKKDKKSDELVEILVGPQLLAWSTKYSNKLTLTHYIIGNMINLFTQLYNNSHNNNNINILISSISRRMMRKERFSVCRFGRSWGGLCSRPVGIKKVRLGREHDARIVRAVPPYVGALLLVPSVRS